MSQSLPQSDYTWCSEEELTQVDWSLQTGKEEYGYICMVDISFPDYIHDMLSDFPCAYTHIVRKMYAPLTQPFVCAVAPETQEIRYEDLSPYMTAALRQHGQLKDRGKESVKLTATLRGRKDYVVHCVVLAQLLRLGAKLERVSRAIKFRQGPWLKGFVDKMTQLRKEAVTELDADASKRAINSCYGKYLQNQYNKQTLYVCRSPEVADKCMRNKFFEQWNIVDENCIFFYAKKKVVRMDRPLVIGFTVLELSKAKMFSLFHEAIRSRFPDVQLVCSDTDSLIIASRTISKDSFLEGMKDHIDFSNFPPSHLLYSFDKHRVPGLLKDENRYSNHIVEICALKSKVYSYRCITGKEQKKAKGVSKAVVKRDFSVALYAACLNDNSTVHVSANRLQSRKLCMQMIRQRKLALSSTDSKRYIAFCGVHTLPYGHYRIRSDYTQCHVCGATEQDMISRMGASEED